jgi:hypothetical protein
MRRCLLRVVVRVCRSRLFQGRMSLSSLMWLQMAFSLLSGTHQIRTQLLRQVSLSHYLLGTRCHGMG